MKYLSPYQKLVMVILAITQFTVVLDFMVMSPLGDILMKSMDINPKQFGLAVSSYAFSAGVSGIFASGFADKYDRKNFLIIFYTGFILGTFLCATATTYEFLIFARIFTGIFGGVLGAISMAIVTDLFSVEQRGRVLGILQMGFGASQVMGIPIGLYLANIWNWHAPFSMIVILSIILLIIIWFTFKPINAHLKLQNSSSAGAHFLEILKKKEYRITYLFTALLSVGGYLMMPFGSAYAVNNLGIKQADLPLIFMCTGISSLIIMPIVGRLSDKISKVKIFTFASIWASVFVLIYTNLEGPLKLYTIIPLNILMFIGIMSRFVPSSALTSSVPTPKDRGGFMSLNGSIQQITGGFATLIAGFIIVQDSEGEPLKNYPVLGILGVLFMIICVFLLIRVNSFLQKRSK